MIHNLKKYKESLVYITHLEAILLIIGLSIKGLLHYKAYVPVAKILLVMEDQKRVLESHLQKHRKIRDSKGQN